MKDQQGHNYFFVVPEIPWKGKNMAPSILDRLDDVEDRISRIERALEALLEWQEEVEDAVHDETA